MSKIHALIFSLCLALAGFAAETHEELVCPIDGFIFKEPVAPKGETRGIRLDTRRLGEVADPPPIPQCPHCRFVVFNNQIPESVAEKLRPFIKGDYRELAAKEPSYGCLALIQEYLRRHADVPSLRIAQSHLFASWQTEGREAVSMRHLRMAYEAFSTALGEMTPEDKERPGVTLLCAELERRFGLWDAAAKRLKAFRESNLMEPHLAPIIERQISFINLRDSAAHAVRQEEEHLVTPGAGKKPVVKNPPKVAPVAKKAAPTPAPKREAVALNLDQPLILGPVDTSPPPRAVGGNFAPATPPRVELEHSPTGIEDPPALPDPVPVAQPKKSSVAAKTTTPRKPVKNPTPEPEKAVTKVEPENVPTKTEPVGEAPKATEPEPKTEPAAKVEPSTKIEPSPKTEPTTKPSPKTEPEPKKEIAKTEPANELPKTSVEPKDEPKKEEPKKETVATPKKQTAKPVTKPAVKAAPAAVVAQPGDKPKSKPKLIGAP
jgi:hypothetical protein